MTFNPALHGLRACAALAVLLFHCNSFFPELSRAMNFTAFGVDWTFALWAWNGWMGVPLFFILSGYLLGGQLVEKTLNKTTVLSFWARRFIRIYPAYWAQLLILLLFGRIAETHFQTNNWQDIALHLLLWINLPSAWVQPINPLYWTLPIELSFYLCLPFIIWMQRKVGILAVFLLSAATMFTWRAVLIQENPDINLSTILYLLDAIPGTLATFMTGVLLVFIPKTGLLTRKYILIAASIAMYLWLKFFMGQIDTYWTGSSLLIYANFIIAIILATIVYTCLDSHATIGFLSSKLFVWLGHISYGIYLWHYPALLLIKSYWPTEWEGGYFGFLALFICVLLSCIFASLSYYYIELPAMRWGTMRLHNRK